MAESEAEREEREAVREVLLHELDELTEKKIESLIKVKDMELDDITAQLSKRVMDSYSAFG